MTSVRKRKMNRSSVRKNTRRTKDKQRDINIHSNPIIAANWDKSLTLQQNYKRLGLRAKLGTPAGGQERKIETLAEYRARKDNKVSVEDISQTDDPTKIPEGEARLIRDPETNEVTKVIYGTMKVNNEGQSESSSTSIVQQLEEYASKRAPKRERLASERENDWLKALFEKHGDDYDKMKWDKKLNIYQQSVGDLRRRITKWKKSNNIS
ncbi:ribosome biogenesis protein Nop16 [Scheffersomyces amazonensis]|uniref:ribosome biogenesis protein Nop16 n=1 Tax=Scheffersomyces amazonensis TaxID=1078765 RepID=UPI00315D5DD2